MKTVKRRDFERQFSKYMKESVIVVGRHEEKIGTWVSEDVRQDMSDKEWRENLSHHALEGLIAHEKGKKYLDDLVAGVMNKDECNIVNAHVVNSETGEKSIMPVNFPAGLCGSSGDGSEMPTEMCTRCKKQKTELGIFEWEAEDEFICESCVYEVFPLDKAKKFLKTLEKVEIDRDDLTWDSSSGKSGSVGTVAPLKPQSKTSTFNPMPKPVKKKRKK